MAESHWSPWDLFGLIYNCLICYYTCDDHILYFYSSHYLYFMIHSLHGLKKEKNWLAAKVWVFIAQLVEHCSNLVEGSGGWWLVFVECASVKCRRNISSCINTTFLDFLQPLHAVIDFNLRLRILVTMFRISRLCPSVISILKVWKSLSLHLMWSPFCEKQAHNSTDRDQFLRKIPQNVFSLPTKSCVHA